MSASPAYRPAAPDNLVLATTGARAFLDTAQTKLDEGKFVDALKCLEQGMAHIAWAKEITARRRRAARRAKA